jgi:hypothetical protein
VERWPWYYDCQSRAWSPKPQAQGKRRFLFSMGVPSLAIAKEPDEFITEGTYEEMPRVLQKGFNVWTSEAQK